MPDEVTEKPKKKRKPRQPKIGAYIVQRRAELTSGHELGWIDVGQPHAKLHDAKNWLLMEGTKGESYRIASVSQTWTVKVHEEARLEEADVPPAK